MSDTRKLVALLLAVMAFGLVVFGVVRGLSDAGPASGTRLIVTLAPPVNSDAVAQCADFAKARLTSGRVLAGGDGLVIELASQDPAAVSAATAKLEAADSPARMHVASAIAFTRATGFVGRAWVFLALGGGMLAAAGVIALRR